MDNKRKFLVQLIEKLKNQVSDREIAIIGVTGRYPQANTLEAFWNNLKNGTNCISEIPADRWNWQEHYDQNGRDSQISQIYSKWGGFIADVDKFDPLFFNISPLYAQATDPQERLFLETVWALFEDAGYTRQTLAKLNHQVGTFVGVTNNNYEWLGGEATAKGHLTAARSAYWSIANRVSYYFDFTGPSLAIDTACSSSLTAIHLACDSLKKGECQMAIAGGVNLILHPMHYYRLCYQKMLASDDRCKSFGEGADGFVDGEGIGAILLKPLQQAIKDKDTIYGVIKGSSINAGGKTSGYMVPNPNAQAELIKVALKNAQIDPKTISYVEAQATGSSLGDPIEITGLMKAYQTHERQFCSIGSVKSNIGHLESAAGIAALTKVLLQLKYKQLVPSLHSERLNPHINFEESPFFVQQGLSEWKSVEGYPRRAGISSFGAGGANAHLIVEEYEAPVIKADIARQESHVVVLSARNEERLQVYVKNVIEFLNPALSFDMTGDVEATVDEAEIQQDLLKVAGEILKVSDNEIDLDETLSDLGFDTVSLTDLSQKLNDKYLVSLTPALLSEYPSLALVAKYLCDNFQAGESTALKNRDANFSLAELAYTLQVGREAMAERLALVVESVDDLREKLSQYVQGQSEINDFYRGNVKKNPAQNTLLLDGKAGFAFMKVVIEKKDFPKLAQLWISGVEIDWQLLYPNQKPQRISLPTYPFAKERYWISASESKLKVVAKVDQIAKLHPLLGSNTSTLAEQKFTTQLTGEEFYLTDHIVAEQKTLPGVAYLEMARAAGELAGEQPIITLSNIVWAKPITVSDTPKSVHISLFPDQQRVEFEITTLDDNQQRQIHAQGKLTYGTQKDSETIDIEAIQNRCFETWDGAKCYQLFKTTGLNYGPNFQTIQALYRNDTEALSRLFVPKALTDDFVLHPSLMDGALQTVIGLMGQTTDNTPYLPFALGAVELFGPLSAQCYAYVRKTNNPDSAIKKFNISILSETGQEQVRIKDFSVRALKPQTETPVTMYYQSVWENSVFSAPFAPLMPTGTVLLFDTDDKWHSNFKERLKSDIILVTPGENYQKLGPQTYSINPNHPADYQKLLAALSLEPSHIIHLWSQAPFVSDKINAQLENSLFSIFHLTQALLSRQPQNPIQLLYIYTETPEAPQPQYAAFSGFAKTIRLENPKLSYKTVALPNLDNVVEIALTEFQTPEIEIRYEKGQRWVKQLQEIDSLPETTPKLKENGVYLITGGAGGLGLIFAEYLANNFKARLVLSGRSDLSAEKAEHIQSLNLSGAEVIYHKADISKRDEVVNLIAQTQSRFNEINGIIHSAGVRKDAFVIKKTSEEMATVLAPKIYGTIYLDEATQNEPLDFFVLFSSVAAVMGNVGQCDYASANAFMDNFALWRDGQKRFGKTVSINWPLWQDGGMHIDEQTEKWLSNTMGMQALSTETGLEAFSQGLGYEKNQFLVLEGYESKVRKKLGLETTLPQPTASSTSVDQKQLLKRLQKDLLSQVSTILKVNAKDIDLSEDISEYGFDSISFTDFANRLNEKYRLEITPAIFFEYPSVGAFSEFMCQEYQERLLDYYSDSLKAVSTKLSLVTTETINTEEIKLKSRFIEPVTVRDVPKANTPIAIIGMSGVMPQSPDLESFWQHLEAGDDLITEVPIERWDWQAYYGDPIKPNKTKAKWGGFMPAVEQFDPLFFDISPREAELMDPQQRLFLETVWKTIENAGYKASDLSGTKTGLFVGVATHDYDELLRENVPNIEAHTSTGMAHSILANRISYLLNLHGPSEPIDTACSSSLVAIHRAVEAIRSGNCEMAIAGGVNVMLTPTLTLSFSKAGMLSEDGRCKTFDKRANGYVRGEGVGAIWLKPLEKAQADGDTIKAVIKGTAENHGGHATSLTAPNPNAQTQLLISAYESANIDPSTVSYIEAHGTGTSLGDPIEINGLKNAFVELYKKSGKSLPVEPHCGIGSVKTNIGHLETAAGIAGVFKVLLAMKHKTLPGNLHFSELNPYIELQGSPFYVVSKNQTWAPLIESDGRKIARRAGVSSFGFGGANAHLVLEEYESRLLPQASDFPQLIVLSAKNDERLQAYALLLVEFLEKQSEISLLNLAYTLQVGREAMAERLALVVESVDDLKDKLSQYVQGQSEINDLYRGNVKTNKAQSELLIEGEEGIDFVKSIIKNRKLTKLAQLWVSGIEIDWQLLHPTQKPQRISLPTYPFARDRYWVPEPTKRGNLATSTGAPIETLSFHPESKTIYFRPQWQSQSLELRDLKKEPILLLGSNQALVEQLQQQTQIFWAKSSNQFEQIQPNQYGLDLQDASHSQRLIHSLPNTPQQVVYCLEQTIDNSEISTRYLLPLIYLSRALIKHKATVQLLIIGVFRADSLEFCLSSAFSGFGKTLEQESTRFMCKTVVAEPPLDNLATLIRQELQLNWENKEVRYTAGQRQVKTYQPFLPPETTTVPLRQQGVYLITGGLGGLGLIFATYLAKNYQARLILTGRSALSAAKTQQLETLKHTGAEIQYFQCDIAQTEAVAALVEQIKNQHGVLHGILHYAGIIKEAYILNKTPEQVSQVLAPKVAGTIALDQATEPQDFLVLFSSIAAVVGIVGQSDYAFANAFMDAFVQYRDQPHTLSINWPLWKTGGMQMTDEAKQLLYHTKGIIPLEEKAGIQALLDGLSMDSGQLIVMQGDADKIQHQLTQETKPTTIQSTDTLSMALRQKIEDSVLTKIASIVKVNPKEIELTEEMSQYGLDSIMLTEVTNQLNLQYQLDLTPAILYEYSTFQDFANYLADTYGNHFAAHYQKSLPTSQARTSAVVQKPRAKIQPIKKPMVDQEPIAIIGISGTLPSSPDLDSFWQHIAAGDDLIQEIPKERWDWKAFYGEGPNQTLAKWGGFMDEVDQFDALFFGISPKEARFMDPQQRLVLQTVWQTIEKAGIRPSSLSGSQTGLFVGVTYTDYLELVKKHTKQVEPDIATGLNHTILANRISYRLNLHGPSEPINTACSSSLIAIHRAVNAIHHGECEMAIAGGVQIILDPMPHIALSKGGMLSKDGRCKTFDKSANGFARGEGVGAILLKPLSQAQADGNPIYAVIRGTAENHGGHAQSLTSPNPNAQAELLIKAYEKANISPETVSYFEAHGTGTSLGDPIEINGLKKAFAALYQKWGLDTIKTPYCGLGSVKTNIGHLESAAGIAGVLKVLLMMQHKTLPATLHLKELNPYIELQDSPFYIVDSERAWEPLYDDHGQAIPRRAGVSSFGFGGSNGHVVLEEYPQSAMDTSSGPQIIVLSAKNADRLTAYAKKLATFLKQPSSPALANIAWTLQTGREAMEERLALVVDSLEQLTEKLAQFIQPHQAIEGLYQANIKKEKNRTHLLLEGEAGKAYVDIIMQTRDFAKLANLWVAGIDIDWALLYPNGTPNLVPLPTYPFAKKRYWISDVSQRQTDQQTPVAKPKPVSVKTPAKQETLPPARIDKNDASHVLLLSSNRALAEHLQREIDLIRVEPGNNFQQMIQNQPTQIIYYLSETDDAIETQIQPLDYLKKAEPKQFIQLLTVIPTKSSDQLREAFQDYGKTLQQNNPQFLYKTVMTETQLDSEWLAKMLKKELQLATLQDCDVRYQDGQRQVKSYHSLGNPYQLMQMLKF